MRLARRPWSSALLLLLLHAAAPGIHAAKLTLLQFPTCNASLPPFDLRALTVLVRTSGATYPSRHASVERWAAPLRDAGAHVTLFSVSPVEGRVSLPLVVDALRFGEHSQLSELRVQHAWLARHAPRGTRLILKVDDDSEVHAGRLAAALACYAAEAVGGGDAGDDEGGDKRGAALRHAPLLGACAVWESEPVPFCDGGAGYLFSRRHVALFLLCRGTEALEDVAISLCLARAGVPLMNHPHFHRAADVAGDPQWITRHKVVRRERLRRRSRGALSSASTAA